MWIIEEVGLAGIFIFNYKSCREFFFLLLLLLIFESFYFYFFAFKKIEV